MKKYILILIILQSFISCDSDPSGKFTFILAMPMLLLAWIIGKIVRSPWDDKKNTEDIVDVIISILIGAFVMAVISGLFRRCFQ